MEINQGHRDSEIHKSRLQARKQTHRYWGQIGEKQINQVPIITKTWLLLPQIFCVALPQGNRANPRYVSFQLCHFELQELGVFFNCNVNLAQRLDFSDFTFEWILHPVGFQPGSRGSGYEREMGLILATLKSCSKTNRVAKQTEPWVQQWLKDAAEMGSLSLDQPHVM